MLPHLKHTLRLKRYIGWMLVLAGAAAGLCFVPLFNLLAYEFCLALALLGSLAAAHLGAVQVACARGRDEGLMLGLARPLRAVGLLVLRGVVCNLLLLVLPLLLISLNALRVKNCDLAEGLAFFAMMPVLSVVLATAMGTLWALAVPRAALATAASLLTLAASLALGVWRFYDSPAIFAHDPFVGYFPGTLYDEDVAIRAPYLFSRLYNLVWLAAALLWAALLLDPSALRLRLEGAAQRIRQHRRAAALATALVAAGVGLWTARGPLGFAMDAEQIQHQLGGVRHSAHFTIYHPREMKDGEVDLLVQDHEFRHAQLARLFSAAPPRITSYIFGSVEQKRRLMGAGRTFIAKPWRREVYLHQLRFPHPVLKHELAHVFAGLYGDRWFGISLRWRGSPVPHPLFNVGLIEGIAVAADWRPRGELTGHQTAAVLQRSGLAPPLASLFGTGFLQHAAGRSYTMAGSFCRYLVRHHGMARLEQVFHSGGRFEAAYGRSLGELLGGWKAWLATVQVPAQQVQLARERFRRPAILRRVCGHEVANRVAHARKLAGQQHHLQAAKVMAQVCRFDPSDPAHAVEQMELLAAAGKPDAARALYRQVRSHPALSKPMERRVMELLGDLAWRSGETKSAASWYDRAARRSAGAYGRRVLHLKRWALTQPDDLRQPVLEYLVRDAGQRDGARDVHLAHRLARALEHAGAPWSRASTLPSSTAAGPKRALPALPGAGGLGHFLVGKQLAARGHHSDAVGPLRRALRLGLPNADFVVEASRTLLLCQYRTADHAGARGTARQLLTRPGLAAGVVLETRDWVERIRWRTTGKIPRRGPQPLVTPRVAAHAR